MVSGSMLPLVADTSGLGFESWCMHMQAVAAVPSPGPPNVGGCQKTCTVRSPIDPWEVTDMLDWGPTCCPLQPARPRLVARSPPFLLAAIAVRCPALPCPAHFPRARAPPYLCVAPLVAHHPALLAMASLNILTFDHEGRLIQFDTWLDDLQLYLLSDSRDSVSLFDHTSGAPLAPPATADSATRSQWLTHDAAARLAVCNHLPLAERAHFSQHKTAQALYDAVVARYSSPATAALGRLILPYLFPELSPFATVEDLITHLRTSVARYRFALQAEVPHPPPPLPPPYASATAVDILGAEDVGTASALSGKRRSGKGKGGKSGGSGSEGGGGVGGGGGGGGGSGGSGGGSEGFGGGGGGSGGGGGGGGGSSGSGGNGSGGGRGGAVQRGGFGGGQGSSSGVGARPLRPSTFTCRKLHTQHRCFSRLDDAWRAEFGDEDERPRWPELLRSRVDIFALDYDAILATMHALSVSAKGDCYLYVPPDPGVEAATLGASESALPGTALTEALHTFTLDSGASRCFFRDSTTITPLPSPVSVRLSDPSGGPVLARSSTVLLCPAVPSGSLSVFHLPSFSTNLMSTATLQDAMVTTTTPGGQRVSICTCTRKSRHQATFTHRPWSSLYTLTAKPPQVAASAQVSASGPVAAPCLCRLLMHQTLLWHHRLGHPSLPRLRGMHSRLLVFGLPRSLPPLPPSPAPPCLPCVEGRQRATPHSSSFPPTTAPLQTVHMDVWGPARVSGQGRECYFVLLVDDYRRYTTVFPLRSTIEVSDVLIPWIRAVRLQLRERFREDLLVQSRHSDRGGEFSSDLLREFCQGEGILESFTLPASPQKNGIAERRIGLVMEVARTSMIHAAAPHILWPFAVRYAAHQLNLWPRVSSPETSPTLRWTGKVGDASVFQVWGSCAFVCDTFADKLSSHAIPCVDPLPGTVPVEVVVDSGAARDAVSGGAASGGAASGGAEPARVEPGGAEPAGAEPGVAGFEGAESGGAEPGDAEPGGTEPEGAEPGGAGSEGAESWDAEPRGTASSGGHAGALQRLSPRQEPLSWQQLREWFAQRTRLRSGTAGAGGSAAGGTRAGGTGATRLGGAGVTAGAGGTGGAGAAGPGGARTRGTGTTRAGGVGGAGAGDPGVGGTGAGGAKAGGTGAGDPGDGGTSAGGAGAGGAGVGDPCTGGAGARGTGAGDPGAGGAGVGDPGASGPGARGTVQRRPFLSQPQLHTDSPLPAPSPYAKQTDSPSECREPASRPASPVRAVRTGRRVPCPHPPPVPGTHVMALCPSSVPLRVPLRPPPESSLPAVPDPESGLACAASPNIPRLLATVVTDPSFESTAASALVAELVDFAAACRLDYATSLVAESESDCPPSVGGECALGMDVLEDKQEDFTCLVAAVPHLVAMLLAPEGDPDAQDILIPYSHAEAITDPYSSQWKIATDAEMAS
ncbi:unnamed protein product [Closterium sp. NIES-54]